MWNNIAYCSGIYCRRFIKKKILKSEKLSNHKEMNMCLHFFLCVDLLIDRDTVLQLLGNLKSLLHDQESPFT